VYHALFQDAHRYLIETGQWTRLLALAEGGLSLFSWDDDKPRDPGDMGGFFVMYARNEALFYLSPPVPGYFPILERCLSDPKPETRNPKPEVVSLF